jgi:hypothetical protein
MLFLHPLTDHQWFNRIATADYATFFDPAIETRSVVQRQINRQAEKLFEILAWEIEPPAEKDSFANAKALSDKMM